MQFPGGGLALQVEKESIVAATLSEAELDELNGLLRRLLMAFTNEFGNLSKRRA
jgi:hypothetical protein